MLSAHATLQEVIDAHQRDSEAIVLAGFNDGITDTVKQHKINTVLSPLFILSQGIKNLFPVELKSRRESQFFEYFLNPFCILCR